MSRSAPEEGEDCALCLVPRAWHRELPAPRADDPHTSDSAIARAPTHPPTHTHTCASTRSHKSTSIARPCAHPKHIHRTPCMRTPEAHPPHAMHAHARSTSTARPARRQGTTPEAQPGHAHAHARSPTQRRSAAARRTSLHASRSDRWPCLGKLVFDVSDDCRRDSFIRDHDMKASKRLDRVAVQNRPSECVESGDAP